MTEQIKPCPFCGGDVEIYENSVCCIERPGEVNQHGATYRELMKAWNSRAISLDDKTRPLSGKWHHGDGALVCGTLRIAREDFDTNPSDKVKAEIFDWMCSVLNSERENDSVLSIDEKDQLKSLKEFANLIIYINTAVEYSDDINRAIEQHGLFNASKGVADWLKD